MAISNSCGRIAGHDRIDRQRPRLSIGEDRDRDPGGPRFDIDLTDGIAELIDRHEIGVLVDVNARRLDEDAGPDSHDALNDRSRTRHLGLDRADARLTELETTRDRAAIDHDIDELALEPVEIDGDCGRLDADDRDPVVDRGHQDGDPLGAAAGDDGTEVNARLEIRRQGPRPGR